MGYWLPHLIDWVLGGSATTVVAIVLRRAVTMAAEQTRAHAVQAVKAAHGASTAAAGASVARTGAEAAEGRLEAAEARLDGMLEAVSASLGHRARDDLRFREIERQLRQGGRHAAASDHQEGH